jgi:putative ABC transport system permease protein
MPASFAFPQDGIEIWCLPGFNLKQTGRRSHFLFAVGRLKPGVSLRQAAAEMNTIAERLGVAYHQPEYGIRLVPLQEEIVGNARRSLLVLWAAVVAVLVIACANVAGLLLARAVARHKEVAIRSALGGSRSRLIQQFLAESVLLAVFGGALGVALSYSAGRLIIAASRGAVPRLNALQIDGWVLAFSATACIVTGVLFGLAPAISALRFDLNASLKESGPAAQISSRLSLRSILVVVEVALAMVLLVSGGLLAKTLWRLQHVDAGFQADNVLTFRMALPQVKYPTGEERSRLYQNIAERLAALPAVESVGATNDLPFAGSRSQSSFDIEGRAVDPAGSPYADYRTVSPGYFSAMKMRVLAGREFSLHDNQDGPLVAVVNQAFVKKYFPKEDPLGHRLKSHDKIYEIVGVVADVKHQDLGAPAPPELYICYLQANPPGWAFFVVRGRTEPRTLAAAVRNAVSEIAPSEPIYRVRTLAELLEYWMTPQKFNSLLLAVFAGLALVLAAIGIYGVIAYSVVQRTREIGIRIALGAERGHVLRLILRHGARIGILGLGLGTAAAYAATRALSSMLFGVDPHDPGIFLGIAFSLSVVVMLASYIPARKATRVNPLVALRHE